MMFGLALALPISAAAEPSDAQPVDVAAVEVSDSVPAASAIQVNAGTQKSDAANESSREVRGSRNGDPGVRFNNPYAFPLQTLPIAMPNFSSLSF
jgi:hypothetical protein